MGNYRLQRVLWFSLALDLVVGGAPGAQAAEVSYVLPDAQGTWALPTGIHIGRAPSGTIAVEIRGVGTFLVDPSAVRTRRPELFRPGHFSVFDIVAHLAEQGKIQMSYRFDPDLNTHLIESLNGRRGWWYDAHYPGGGFEQTTVRMDHYPVKDGMKILLYLERPDRLAAIVKSFREEVARLAANEGRVIIPEVTIRGPRGSLVFRDVLVTPHDVRSDVFQPGVVTALDVLLSLGELGMLSGLRLTWHAEPVASYYVDLAVGTDFAAEAVNPCAFVCDVGDKILAKFRPPHVAHTAGQIHFPPDLHVLVSPEYVRWVLVCP